MKAHDLANMLYTLPVDTEIKLYFDGTVGCKSTDIASIEYRVSAKEALFVGKDFITVDKAILENDSEYRA